jgi:hypothetical protein
MAIFSEAWKREIQEKTTDSWFCIPTNHYPNNGACSAANHQIQPPIDSRAGRQRRRTRNRVYQATLRKTLAIVESSAASLNGLISTVAFTRLKKNSMAGLFRWPVKKMNR